MFYDSLVATAHVTDNTAFVDLLQRNVTGSVDPGISASFASQIASGAVTQGAVAQLFADSPAGTARIQPFVTSQGIARL